jgi:NitT/TauT family transport system substrate-binding protein
LPRPYDRMRLRGVDALTIAFVALAVAFLPLAACAEVSTVRISYGYGILYLPLSGKGEINSHMASPPFSYVEDATPGLHRVFNSVDVLGNITLDITFTTRRFVETNPKLTAAFVAAMEDACALIANDKRKAAEIYNAVAKVKQPVDETLKILNDPNTKFSVVPDGTMRYAEFMARVGTIKVKPASWRDLFFSPVSGLAGS